MSEYLTLFLLGRDGSRWNLTDESEGVLLRKGPSKLIDAPAKTYWLNSATGAHYQGMTFERRDPVFSVQISGRDPAQWADRDSRFRMALGLVGEDTFWLEAHTSYGVRRLEMRLLTEPIAYASAEWEGYDPWLRHESTLGISAACERPFWESSPVELEWIPPTSTATGTVMVPNRGDVPVFWRGFANAPGRWRVFDRSWGQKIYAKATYPFNRAADDAARMVWLPTLVTGEDTSIDSDPDEPTLIAANGAPVQDRWQSNGILYPIAPWTPPTPVTVQCEGVQAGAGIKFWIPRRFSRPWGVTI
ncbi:hypothetical protein [Nocardia brasiliensis]|uniref:hypothetical protein n=1 Tax=Nocardia brasiliensis TaxID=37326 RepID=UPI00068DDB3E|nr:hypothetical protein [Nocardia brasiliensis]